MLATAWLLAFLSTPQLAHASVSMNSPAQQAAERAQARLVDLPLGWRTAHDTSNDSQTKCFGSDVIHSAGASERDFAKGEIAIVQTLVSITRSPADAERGFALIASDKTWNCLAAELKKEEGLKEAPQQGRFLLKPVGARVVGRELLFTVEQGGLSVTAYLHVDVARKGTGVIVLISLDAFSSALTLDEESRVLRRMVSRLP